MACIYCIFNNIYINNIEKYYKSAAYFIKNTFII